MARVFRIHLSPPDIREAERQFLTAALDSGWAAPAGPDLAAFEVELGRRTDSEHVVALASGTAALHLALLVCGVGPADRVITSTFTFAASAFAITYVGATPVFLDSETTTWNMDPELLAAELAASAARGERPAAVLVVDLYGQCADYDAIVELCERYEVPLVEDAAEALGATWRGRPAGSFGALAALSFNGNKIITTSSGGALVCRDAATADRVRYLATQARQPVAHYEHVEVGFNYRMSNLLAAFGRGQLSTLDERIARRREIRRAYEAALIGVPGINFAPQDPRGGPNHWLTCLVLGDGTEVSPTVVVDALARHGIEARPLWKPMHLQPVFAESERRVSGVSDALFGRGLCLPSGSSMSDAAVEETCGIVADVVVAGPTNR